MSLHRALQGVSDYLGQGVMLVVDTDHPGDRSHAEVLQNEVHWHEICVRLSIVGGGGPEAASDRDSGLSLYSCQPVGSTNGAQASLRP